MNLASLSSILLQEYQSKELPSTRIQPDRRWFGNTRVIGQKQLDQFRTEMSTKVNDAYTVLLREKKLPLQLLEDPEKKVRWILFKVSMQGGRFRSMVYCSRGWYGLKQIAAAQDWIFGMSSHIVRLSSQVEPDFANAVRFAFTCYTF